MVRIYLLIFILGLGYSSIAQTDTLRSLLDTNSITVSIHDTIPLQLFTEDAETINDLDCDTIDLKGVRIFSAVSKHECALVSIQHNNRCIIWDFFNLFAVHKLDIDTITLNQKTYLIIEWEHGDGRWWWQDRSGGITIVDLNEPTCILHLITYRSLYETNAEDKRSNVEPLVDCNYTQSVYFKESLLIIEPAKIERHTNNDEANDCPTPYIAGKYILDGINWIRVD